MREQSFAQLAQEEVRSVTETEDADLKFLQKQDKAFDDSAE